MIVEIAYVFCACAFVCALMSCVAAGTPAWGVYELSDGSRFTAGLFVSCTPDDGCINYPTAEIPDYVTVTQVFLNISTILYFANIVYCITVALKKSSAAGIVILFGLAAIFSFVAMTVFTAFEGFSSLLGPGSKYGYSYSLGWATFGLSLIFIPLFFVLMKAFEDFHAPEAPPLATNHNHTNIIQ